tara:strand:+ start:294 stop:1379 length:1086 start_codon:yes stop_codon:yes gene_type:complete
MNDNIYISYIRKILFTIIMAVITSVIGIILNHLMNSLTDSILPDSIPNIISSNKFTRNLNSYEKQIYETVIDPNTITDRLNIVGGLNEIKEDIKSNILLPLKHPKIFFSKESSILRPSRGIILHGPPGTGKTMIARAISAEANVPFLSLSLSSLENKYYGESSKLIQAIFSLARKIQPCIVFFDEIDGLMKQRNELDQSSVYGFKTELLAQIDGMGSRIDDSIFIIGTTNNLDYLDNAIKRRMPKLYEVQLPNRDERNIILRLKTNEDTIHDTIIQWAADNSEKYSGSDLSELVRRASAFRLQDQCQDEKFTSQLQFATCLEDIYPLMSLKKRHFEKAFEAMGTKIEKEDEEEAPPPPPPA